MRVVAGAEPKKGRKAPVCGYVKPNGKPCRRAAGWGTDHPAVGVCKDHECETGFRASLPVQGRDLWDRLEPALKARKLLTELDYPAFYALCLCYGLAMEAAEKIQKEGHTVKGTYDTVKKNPHLTAFNENLRQFRQWCAEFGLTPTARERLGVDAGRPADEMEALLATPT